MRRLRYSVIILPFTALGVIIGYSIHDYLTESELIQLLLASGTLVVGVSSLFIGIWLAYASPQAKLSKLQIKEKIRIQREEHYARLEQQVLRPLSSVVASASSPSFLNSIPGQSRLFTELKLAYDLQRVRSSRYYPDALRHLREDYPSFESDVKALEDKISELNNDVNDLQQKAEETVSNELSPLVAVSRELPLPDGSSYLPNIMTIIESCWSFILYRHLELKNPLKEILSDVKPLETDFPRSMERSQDMMYGGSLLGRKITQDKEAQVISVMNQLRTDLTIPRKLIQLRKKQKGLILKSREIASKLEDLSFKIDSRKYETVATCCPKAE